MAKAPAARQVEGADAAGVLLPYQQRWVEDQSPFKVMEKGRRTGVTWAEAADDVLIAASPKSNGGQNVYYVGTDKEMTEEYIDACAMWAKAFNRVAGDIDEGFWDEGDEGDRHIMTFTIRFPESGHKIVALASRPRKLRGRQGVLVADEAAFQDHLDELINAAMAFLIWGGKVRLISTHFGRDNPFNELVQDLRAGRQKGSLHRVPFRDAVEQGLYRRVCLRLGKAWSAADETQWVEDTYAYYRARGNPDEELDCIPRDSGGRWLSLALIEQRLSTETPVLRLACRDGFEALPDHIRQAEVRDWLDEHCRPLLEALDPESRSFFGFDFGRSGDLSVLVPLLQGRDVKRRPPFLLEMRNVPFRQQEQVLFYVVDRLPRFLYGNLDARGNGQYLAEVAMQRYGGGRIGQVMLSEAWYREHMPPLKAALEDGDLDALPKDQEVIDDLRAFEMVRGVPRLPESRTSRSGSGQRHGDAGIAIALGYDASRQDVVEVEFASTGARASTTVSEALERTAALDRATGFGTVGGRPNLTGY